MKQFINTSLCITNCGKLLYIGKQDTLCGALYCPCKKCKWSPIHLNPCNYFPNNIIGIRVYDYNDIEIKKVSNFILRMQHIIYFGISNGSTYCLYIFNTKFFKHKKLRFIKPPIDRKMVIETNIIFIL